MKTSVSTRNARVTIAISFLEDLAFILPIWLLFGTEQLKLSVTSTTALFMLVWMLSGFLEIPTGALADRLGRKKMYLIGVVLFSLYPLAYFFTLPIPLIALLSVVAAFGSALRSGTLVALTHSSYKAEGRSEKSYHSFLSNQLVSSFIARAISGVAGGALYAFNPLSPYLAMTLTYWCMFIVGLFAIEIETERSTLSNKAHVFETLRQLAKRQIIVALFGVYVTLQIVGEAVWTAYQPFFTHDGFSPQTIGLLFSAMAIVSAGGAIATKYAMRRIGVLAIETLLSAFLLATMILLNLPSHTVHIVASMPAAFAFGVSITPLIATIQKTIQGKFHSTALSVVSVAQYVVYGVASLYVSVLIDRLGVITTRKFLLLEATLATLVASTIYIRYRKHDILVSTDN